MVDLFSQRSPIVDHTAINANSSFVEEVATQAQCSSRNEGIPVYDTPMHDPLIGKYFLFTDVIHYSQLRILLNRLT